MPPLPADRHLGPVCCRGGSPAAAQPRPTGLPKVHPAARRAAAWCVQAARAVAIEQLPCGKLGARVGSLWQHRAACFECMCDHEMGAPLLVAHQQAPPPPHAPLSAAAGQLEAARALLECGASSGVPCEGSPPLHVAVCVAAHPAKRAFSEAAVALLLQHGADPYERWGGEHGAGWQLAGLPLSCRLGQRPRHGRVCMRISKGADMIRPAARTCLRQCTCTRTHCIKGRAALHMRRALFNNATATAAGGAPRRRRCARRRRRMLPPNHMHNPPTPPQTLPTCKC